MKVSDNEFPKLILVGGPTPATPTAGNHSLFVDSADDTLKRVDDTGTVTTIEGGVPGGAAFAGCRVWRSAAWSAPNAGGTNVPFDAEDFDTNAFHDLTTNPSRITIPTGMSGYYLISGTLRYGAASNTGGRALDITVNGVAVTGALVNAGNGLPMTVHTATPYYLNAGDYVESSPFQNSGAALALDVASGTHYNSLSVIKIG